MEDSSKKHLSRRGFLKYAATVGTALAVTPAWDKLPIRPFPVVVRQSKNRETACHIAYWEQVRLHLKCPPWVLV